MAKARVGVVGFGTIGERAADGVAKQDDMELIGVVDVAPMLPLRAMVEAGRGYPVFCAIPDRIPSLEEAGISVAGTLDDLLGQVDIVIDATSPGVGAKNRLLYEKAGVKAIFQGGEKNAVADALWTSTCNYNEGLGKNYLKLISCNTTGIARTASAIDKAVGLQKMVATIIRRAADPAEIEKGPIDAAIVGEVPSHQAVDLQRVLPHVEALGFIITVPTTHGHIICQHVVCNREVSSEEARDFLRHSTRIRMFKMADGFVANSIIFDYLRDLGVHRADMYEVGVFEETVVTRGREIYFVEDIPQEAIVIPENIDAIRCLLGMQTKAEDAIARTNKNLGIKV
ncbi:MAG: type II glyceraldehyde-3-phosphate dehydrogenase [Chloroflexi bacterium]|nr:type II glyceraldehyde-3-phosphate dehydrogenase [Chloroflexota bacterium]